MAFGGVVAVAVALAPGMAVWVAVALATTVAVRVAVGTLPVGVGVGVPPNGAGGQRPGIGAPAARPERQGGEAAINGHVPDHHVGQAGVEALPGRRVGGDVVGVVEAPVGAGEDLLRDSAGWR